LPDELRFDIMIKLWFRLLQTTVELLYSGNLRFCAIIRNDVCNCADGQECMCSALADYARKCVAAGVTLQWRNSTICRECRSSL